jgi:hypothetical protein
MGAWDSKVTFRADVTAIGHSADFSYSLSLPLVVLGPELNRGTEDR